MNLGRPLGPKYLASRSSPHISMLGLESLHPKNVRNSNHFGLINLHLQIVFVLDELPDLVFEVCHFYCI